MKSQGKDVVVSARKPARRGWGCVSFFRRGTTGVVTAGGMILGGNALSPTGGNAANGAVVFSNQYAQSLDVGGKFADKDMTWQIDINVPGFGVQRTTTSSMGGAFTAFNFHLISAIEGAGFTFTKDNIPEGNPFNQYNLTVASGRTITSRTWESRVKSIDRTFAASDFLLAELVNPKYGVPLPTFAPVTANAAYTMADFGLDAFFFGSGHFNDQAAGAYMMRSGSSILGGEVDLFSPGNSQVSLLMAGGGIGGASSTTGYLGEIIDPTGLEPKVFMIKNGSPLAYQQGIGSNGAIPFVESGIAAHVISQTTSTNLQYVPEPSSMAVAAAAGFGLLARRRRN